MANVLLTFDDASIELDCREVTCEERLGVATSITLEAFSKEPVDRAKVVGMPCRLRIANRFGARTIPGVAMEMTAFATSNPEAGRRYRLHIRSALAVLGLTRRSRIFQHLSVPDIIKSVLEKGGFASGDVVVSTAEQHEPREYVVQYGEPDATFIRRLCEEEGLYFRFDAEGETERFHLEDTSSSAPEALDGALPLADRSDLNATRASAFNPRVELRRRPGKVTLRDYNQEKPAVSLEAVEKAGTALEQDVEVYEAPGRFLDPAAGGTRAKRRLQSLRADGETVSFESSALALSPGLAVKLEGAPDLRAPLGAEGEHFVVAVQHRWSWSEREYQLRVEAIPSGVPFRLPRVTPRPRVPGIQPVSVTGAPGEEIHVDAQGRVRVRFFWDRESKSDDKSSLPIRVMQPNTPGSMLLPRVGWEVLAAFEDGDPDRPYILGRTYNGKEIPPFSLPTNKTVTALGTFSSPGGGKQNQIRFDDAAGRQNISFAAGFGKTLTVASDMLTQTVKNEGVSVKASQSYAIGATEDVSVKEAYLSSLGSQSGTVGGMQSIFVKGNMAVGVGSESVLVGAACLEKVGNPVAGAKALAKAAALQGAGALGKVGGVIAAAAPIVEAGYDGYQKGGLSGMAKAAGGAGIELATNKALGGVPGASELLGAIREAAPAPWAEKKGAAGAQAAGGGAAGASDTEGPAGPGPGYRNTSANGAYTELVGAAVGMVSPGTVGWTTLGVSTFLVGGSHAIKAGMAGSRTLGVASDTVGSFKITTAAGITRDVKGPINTTIAGSLNSKAGGEHSIKAGAALSIKVGGAMKLKASTVTFVVGGSKVSTSPAGVLLEAGTITITGASTQSKATGHS